MSSVDHSLYNNDWYKREIGAGKIKQILWYFINIVFFINPLIAGSRIKKFWLQLFGAKIGKGVVLKPAINIKYPWKLSIGDYTWIGEKVWIDNLADVKIGKHVCISQGAMLLTGNHNYSKKTFDLMVKGIELEDGVWIGAQSMVCPGIHCKTHAVLSALSVATKNLEPYTIYQGNPAIAVRQRVISETE
ncbi:WcaF family extracellular polysaccharide biosynthesis acetyltransferase [Longitalea luteola]|uniref:WcaF family extracellular polysaccharide biosynthesis acetyltransferase n=1 Tax=Longitalea luteola TaxID=2812563 RepID=UPI001A97BC04|nr:WcaF family extracellular polysaccharide biosynthesis acetyltransferase [Longitalea luteola]